MKDFNNGLIMAEFFCIYVIGLVIGRSGRVAAMSTADFVRAVVLAGVLFAAMNGVAWWLTR